MSTSMPAVELTVTVLFRTFESVRVGDPGPNTQTGALLALLATISRLARVGLPPST